MKAPTWLWRALLLSLGALLVAQGAMCIRWLGFEADEVIYVRALQAPTTSLYWMRVFGHDVPVMMMSYLGALKSWVDYPIYRLTSNGIWAVRLPWLLLAGAAIVIFGLALSKLDGRTSAAITALLLATDVTLVATSTFDWGPVVLQHLLFAVALLLVLNWRRHGNRWWMFAAGVAVGLVLWDKALFLWTAGGATVAGLVFGWREVRRFLRDGRSVAAALVGLVIGMSPLITFNIQSDGATLGQNGHFSLERVPYNFGYLIQSLDGSTPQGAFVDAGRPRTAAGEQNAADRIAVRVDGWFHVQQNEWRAFFLLGILVAGAALAKGTRRRWLGFFAGTAAIGWLQSALTVGTGGSIHHCVLFWPSIYAAVGLALASISERWGIGEHWGWIGRAAAALATLALAVNGLLLVNQFHSNLVQFEAHSAWTPADAALARALERDGVSQVVVTDWGIGSPIAVRSDGKLQVQEEEFEIQADRLDKAAFEACDVPACAVVSHAPTADIFDGASNRFDKLLAAAGLTRVGIQPIYDDSGAPIFEVARIGRLAVAGASAPPAASSAKRAAGARIAGGHLIL